MMLDDLRIGVRALRRDKAFTLAALTALSLGVAANTAVFALFNGAFLRDLPVEAPDRMVSISTRTVEGGDVSIHELSYLDLSDLQAAAQTFDGIAAVTQAPMNLSGDANAAGRFVGAYISANAFRMLGDRPILGRDFTRDDDRVGARPVVIVGHALWRQRYGQDPGVVGRVVLIDGAPATIIGVMPEGFAFPEVAELWRPLAQYPGDAVTRRDQREFSGFGRLKAGVTLEQASAELRNIMAGLARRHPDTNADDGALVTPYQAGPEGRGVFLAVVGAVAFLLLIACANVANLLLARGATRSREMSVRMSLGARRLHVVRQLMTENLLLSVASGLVGLTVSAAGMRFFAPAAAAGPAPYWLEFPFDARVYAFVAILSLATTLVFGLLPAFRVSGLGIVASLNAVGRGATASRQDRRWTGGLVVVQLTLTLILLTGAGLLVRSVASQYQYNPGVDTSDMVTMTIELPDSTYPREGDRRLFYGRLEERLAALPGMRAVFASSAPLLGAFARPAAVEGVPEAETPSSRTSNVTVGPRYFDVLGVAPVRGRTFTDEDGPGSRVAVVNERFAEMYFRGADPIGRRIQLGARFDIPASEWLTVIGIVPNLHHEDNDPREVEDAVYVPYAASPLPSASIIVRSPLDASAVAAVLRDQVRAIDPDLPVFAVSTLDEAFAQTFQVVELVGSVFSTFAGAALLLATIGLYGVTSYSVAQRRREIGVRIALGARPSQVWWNVAHRVAIQVALGLALGLAGGAVTGRLLEGFLWGVGEHDPVTFASVTTLLVVVAFAASYVPARRAMRLDPTVALRE